MTEEELSKIYFIAMDIVWFIGAIYFMYVFYRDREKESFITSLMALAITPVGFIPATMLLFLLIMFFFFEYIPNLLLNDKN